MALTAKQKKLPKTTSNTSKTKRNGQEKEKRTARRKKEGSWLEYFEGIQGVCPWSFEAIKMVLYI